MTNKILLDCEITEATERNIRKNLSKSLVAFLLALFVVMSVFVISICRPEKAEGEINKSVSIAERIEEAIYF